jgi:hypothetical protein
MMQIKVFFKDQPSLQCYINECDVGRRYFNLVKSTYEKSRPIFRDPLRYTEDYMKSLCQQARDRLGWRWNTDELDSDIGAWLHKDLELLLTSGFESIPEELDELVHELHYGLHLWQHGSSSRRYSWLQIEWYNDEGFALDENFQFDPVLNFGEIRLQNPYVGHGPLQMWQEKDFINISQTCKFHDFVKPGFNIALFNYKGVDDMDLLIAKFRDNDPAFVELHDETKIRHYTGYPVIGRVLNLEDLEIVRSTTKILELEKLEFLSC